MRRISGTVLALIIASCNSTSETSDLRSKPTKLSCDHLLKVMAYLEPSTCINIVDAQTTHNIAFIAIENSDPDLYCMNLSSDGKYVAYSDRNATICVFEIESQSLIGRFDSDGSLIRCLAFSADNTLLAAGSNGGKLSIYDIKKRQQILIERVPGEITSIAFSPNKSTIVFSSYYVEQRPPTHSPLYCLNLNGPKHSLHRLSDGEGDPIRRLGFIGPSGRFAALSLGGIAIWSAEDKTLIKLLRFVDETKNGLPDFTEIALSADERFAAFGKTEEFGKRSYIYTLDLKESNFFDNRIEVMPPICGISFSNNSDSLRCLTVYKKIVTLKLSAQVLP